MREWGIAADIRKVLSDDAGNLSSKRILAVGWGMSALGVWIYVSIKTATMAPIPWEVAGMIFSLAGVVAAGKWGEKPPGGTP
jgi:hypothetical protein